MRTSAKGLLVLVLLAASLSARADNREAAREAYRDGTRLYEIAEYGKALEAFKRAYLNFEEPTLLFNIGQCYRMLGDKPNASRFYRTYLYKVPNAPNRAEITRMIDNLDAAIAKENAERPAPQIAPSPAPRVEPEKPEPPKAAPVALTVAAPAPARASTPVYKKWWLWTVVGVVVAGAAVGVGVGVTQSHGETQFPLVHVP